MEYNYDRVDDSYEDQAVRSGMDETESCGDSDAPCVDDYYNVPVKVEPCGVGSGGNVWTPDTFWSGWAGSAEALGELEETYHVYVYFPEGIPSRIDTLSQNGVLFQVTLLEQAPPDNCYTELVYAPHMKGAFPNIAVFKE
ncbi:hypothetical protein ACFYPT_39100 [Streptomyces sp. NPDC005529]|uniref:hypothetical protein n=1 Tax=unclassified Streptomyces TaxID=2593676 RepID=UPI0033BFA7BE